MRTLFGLDKNGGFKVWTIETIADTIKITHGKEGGKMQEKLTPVKGKNIGRANETTPEQQAVLEAESKYKKQVDKGYRANKEELTELEIMPMLAYDYNKQGHRIVYPAIGSPKLDGIRCLAEIKGGEVTLKSRGGKFYNVPHIQEVLKSYLQEGIPWDGELYVHGFALEQIISAVKREDAEEKHLKALAKYKKEPNDESETVVMATGMIAELRESMEFHIFDVVTDEEYANRLERLMHLDYTEALPSCLKVVDAWTLESEDMMKYHHAKQVEKGYEGLMIRNVLGLYESGKRSADLQKYKTFLDDEFRITGVKIDKDGRGVLECYCPVAEDKFTVTCGDHAERERQAKSPELYVGGASTVKYQTRYKDSLLPQFPTGVIIRSGRWEGNTFFPEN